MIELDFFSLEKSFYQVYGRIKLHKRKDIQIYFFLLKKVIAFFR